MLLTLLYAGVVINSVINDAIEWNPFSQRWRELMHAGLGIPPRLRLGAWLCDVFGVDE
jgi:hypothetical protein